MFFKKEIKFFSLNQSITDTYPIYSAKDYKRKWVKNCAAAFQKYKNVVDNRNNVITAAKCPGMREIMEKGYIVTTWCDITIETAIDKPYEYKVYFPDSLDTYLKEVEYDKPIVSGFSMKDSPLKIPTGKNKKIILKFWSPWFIQTPNNYELLVMPVQYDDDPAFTACGGIIESGNHVEFNIHVFWHETNGRVLIPAGTPLCQLIPIKKDPIKIDFLKITDKINHIRVKTIFNLRNKFILGKKESTINTQSKFKIFINKILRKDK
jgi:hypothetical protein